ncbi:MAG: hypothetical protein KIS66_16510 [Fimbriimonadaceae bacterium]|nr:hypothetical protein [Fimbriimonadaceae bacterium]
MILGLVLSPVTLAQFAGAFDSAAEAVRANIQSIAETKLRGGGAREQPVEVRQDVLPPGDSAPERQWLQVVRAAKHRVKDRKLEAEGGVHLIYLGYDLFADEIRGDLGRDVYVLKGNVRAIGSDTVVDGDWVEIRFADRTFSAIHGTTILRPSLLGGRTLQDLFFGGESFHGSEQDVQGERTKLTSCAYPKPHYEIRARATRIQPYDRIQMRNVEVRAFGKRLFNLPFLEIALDSRTNFTPEVGQSRDEGYYIKTLWNVPVRDGDRMDYRVDYFTKLGPGLGADYGYRRPRMEGLVKVYGMTQEPHSLIVSNDHSQLFGRAILQVSNIYERNNYLTAPGSTQERTNASLNMPQGSANTRLTYMRSANSSAGFSFGQTTYGLFDQRRLGPQTQYTLESNWVSSSSGSAGGTPIERSQLDVRFRGQHDAKKLTAELEYVRSIPVGANLNFFSASDRTPVFALRTESRRILNKTTADRIPIRAEVSIGEFADGQTRDRVTRTGLDLNYDKYDRSDRRSRFDQSVRFRQSNYSDDTALWTLQLNPRYSYRLGRDTSFNLRYNYMRSQGYTPLQIDRTGRTDQFTADLSMRPGKPLLLSVQSGYDVLQGDRGNVPWQTVGTKLEWQPTDWFLFRTLATYDPFRTAWTNLRMDLSWQAGATFVTAAARYDGIRHTWGNFDFFLSNLKWGRVATTAVLTYNGFLKKVEAAQLQFTLDLHCWEAILQVKDNQTGFRTGTEYAFFFRLKALPFDSAFGIGQRGQAIGSGGGFGF